MWDWSLNEDERARAENFIASHLLKAIHFYNDNGIGEFELWFIRTKDQKEVVLASGTEQQFVNLCKVLNISELVEDKRFYKNTIRVQHRDELVDLLRPEIAQWNRADLLHHLAEAKVPAGSIRNMQEVFELETAQEMILRETLEDGTESERVATVAFRVE